jgi:hypothetical protein
MPIEKEPEGLPGQWLRRVADHVASQAVREGVLYPLLADLHFEYEQASTPGRRAAVRIRGVLAFWQTLGLSAVLGAGIHLRATVWGPTAQERRDIRQLMQRTLLCAAVVSWALVASFPPGPQLPGAVAWGLIFPANLLIGFPIGMLLGPILSARISLYFPGRRSFWSVSLLAGVATFTLAAWIVPAANQEYRTRVFRVVVPEATFPPAPYVREMGPAELSRHAAELRAEGRGRAAAPYEVEWHKKPALGALSVALAFCGAAIVRRTRRVQVRYLAAMAVAVATYAALGMGELIADAGRIPPAVAMWAPVFVIAVLSALALRSGHPSLAFTREES